MHSSVAVIVASMKLYVLNDLDIHFSYFDLVSLTYMAWPIDIVSLYVEGQES